LSKQRTRNLGWLEALHPEDVESTMNTMNDALRTGKPLDMEYRVRSTDGTWKWMRSRGLPRFGPAGEIIRWYGSVEDIDEFKRTEEALRASQAQLWAISDAMRHDLKCPGLELPAVSLQAGILPWR
jgi:PAS domain-containing protein